MQSKLSQVRSRAIVYALGIGFFAADASAFDEPVISPIIPTTAPTPATPPKTSKNPKDAATRRTTTGSMETPSAQGPNYGVYSPLSSPQSSGPTPQGVSGLVPGGVMGGGSSPAFGSRYGQNLLAPGMPGGTMGGTTGTPTSPGTPGGSGEGTGTGAGTSPAPADTGANFAPDDAPVTGATAGSALNLPNIIGDLGPGIRVSAAPTAPTSPVTVPPPFKVPPRNDVTTFIRVFKISENQSPRPQDRFFYTFNYFNNVNNATNRLDNSPITGIKIYRHVFGFEKTFDEGRGSIGISLPLYNQAANSLANSVLTPGSTALGDLNIFAKYILKENKKTGSLISTGLLLTPPTGTRNIAGADYFRNVSGSFSPVHDLQIQPFLGYIFQRDRFYVQGFSALNVPVSPVDVTQFFNDVQFGYFVYRDRDSGRFLTAIVPTFEAHISNPLNHRGVTSPDPSKNFQYDPYGTPDTVNLTYGLNFEFRRNSVLTFAFAQPVTSFRPFDYEAILLFNYRFGRSRSLVNPPPNVIGG